MIGCFYILEPMKVDIEVPDAGEFCSQDQSQEPLIFRHPSHANEYVNKLQCRQSFMQYIVAGPDSFDTSIIIDPEIHKNLDVAEYLRVLPDELEKNEDLLSQWPPIRIEKLRFAIKMLLQ